MDLLISDRGRCVSILVVFKQAAVVPPYSDYYFGSVPVIYFQMLFLLPCMLYGLIWTDCNSISCLCGDFVYLGVDCLAPMRHMNASGSPFHTKILSRNPVTILVSYCSHRDGCPSISPARTECEMDKEKLAVSGLPVPKQDLPGRNLTFAK